VIVYHYVHLARQVCLRPDMLRHTVMYAALGQGTQPLPCSLAPWGSGRLLCRVVLLLEVFSWFSLYQDEAVATVLVCGM
jgi:hypothetical protein